MSAAVVRISPWGRLALGLLAAVLTMGADGPGRAPGPASAASSSAAAPAAVRHGTGVREVPPGERALLQIEQDGQARVAELAKQMRGLPEGPQLRELQARAERTKLDTFASLLAAQASLARARGDEPRAQAAERALDLLLHPAHAAPRNVAAVPEKSLQNSGGAR